MITPAWTEEDSINFVRFAKKHGGSVNWHELTIDGGYRCSVRHSTGNPNYPNELIAEFENIRIEQRKRVVNATR